ncbi:MAG: SPOR domain-containing protein, partial [Bacteroidota bacterium]
PSASSTIAAYCKALQYAAMVEEAEGNVGPLPPTEEDVVAMTYVPGSATASSDEEDPYYFIYRDQKSEKRKIDSPPANQPATPRSLSAQSGTSVRPAPSVPKPKGASQRFYVIVGSYQTKSQANAKLTELLEKGYGAKVLSRKEGGFRVSAHDFATKSEAATTVNSLKRYNISAWILSQ